MPTTLDAAVDSLAAEVAKTTLQSTGDTRAFAERYAPDYLMWSSQMATAKANGDSDAEDQYSDDLDEINEAALLEAADYGINVQAAAESALENVLKAFADKLVTAAL